MEKLYNTNEFVRLSGISRTTIYRWRHLGLITPALHDRHFERRWNLLTIIWGMVLNELSQLSRSKGQAKITKWRLTIIYSKDKKFGPYSLNESGDLLHYFGPAATIIAWPENAPHVRVMISLKDILEIFENRKSIE